MGMATHINYIPTSGTASDAVRELVTDLRDVEGRYASWCSDDAVHILPGIMTVSTGCSAISKRLSDNWETPFAVAAYSPDDDVTRTVQITGTLDLSDGTSIDTALDALANQVRLNPGESVRSVSMPRLPFLRPEHTTVAEHGLAVTAKVEAVAPKEATETRYVIVTPNGGDGQYAWERGYRTQAAARAAATQAAKKESTSSASFEIIGITRRVSGAPLVHVTRTITKVQVRAEVRITGPKPGAKQAGWVVGGWYHI